ncbi:MAG: TonB-dependent receptor [Acidobacteriia bacterium]|nr:TonB-dependent receptor [Terriglobia bacterium]
MFQFRSHARKSIAQILTLAFLLLAAVCALPAQTGPQGTFVGTVTDSTGAVVPGVKVTVLNAGTQFVSEVTTNSEGNYYVPYLNPGTYRITVAAGGFKQYVRDGIDLRPGETPRFDVMLEVGAASEAVTVTGQAPLLNTETATVATALPQEILQDISNVQKRIVRNLYYMPGVVGNGSQGYHILGNIQRSIGYTLDGIGGKWPGLGTFDQNDQMIQTTQDALEEVKVVTSGMSAEFGHAASGGLQLTFKSGTNQYHGSGEDRFLRTPLVHRSYFQQGTQQPFRYDAVEATFSGPVRIPKLYNGKNKTFFLFGFADHIEDWFAESHTTVPTPEMLNGDFTFGGKGYPLYDPKTIRQVGSTWTSDPMPGNLVPKNRFDPAVVNFLTYNPWAKPNDTGTLSATGPSLNLLDTGEKPITRTRWDVKVDHMFSTAHKMFARYSQAHHRAVANGGNPQLAWHDLDANLQVSPIDLINGVLSETWVIGPTKFNDVRFGYNRRRSTTGAFGADQGWAQKLGIPGVGPENFPYFNIGWGLSALTPSYYSGEEFTVQENYTQVVSTHNLKVGYELLRSRYNQAAGVLPTGTYNFGGTGLPFTPNTGNSFASFLMGSVTSATFSQRFANWLPRWWQHAIYIQDDWKVRHGLTFNLGLRWSYESPFHTKYNQQSQFDPSSKDQLTGLPGALTHPAGYLSKKDLNNFQPRFGMAWNFLPKWVFRASFGVMTQDIGSPGGNANQNFQDYNGNANVAMPTGDPLMIQYHDTEWGVPLHDDRKLFEFLILEGMQAGLSWSTILNKRENFRKAFHRFDPRIVARYGTKDVNRLLADPGIIRNRLKIAAVIDNARRVQELRREHGSFAGWLDAHHPLNRDEWVKLFKRTFRFTGGEIVNEFLMSLGYLAGAHEPNCPIYARIAVLDPPWATENAAGRAMRVADDRAAPN